ncbi:MAG: hypothetical protein AMJ65_12245 [Phycisphaerae bacterium SG8_4]|nr:MAG: hypothetical protein AMJ65_12245 [Phycisphaerae bacterium SG8_4]
MTGKHLRGATCVLIGLLCGLVDAAELSDLVARLEKLDGKGGICGAVHIEDRTSRTDDEAGKPLEKADFEITADANTLSVTVIGKISDSRVFQEFSLLRAAELAQYAPRLARELEGLKLIENRAGSYEGVSCGHWLLKSEKKEKRFGISSTTIRDVELWIDTDGYPLAGSFKTESKGRMLLFKFSADSTRSQRYKRSGNRLVLVLDKNESDVKSKAGAEKRTVTTTVTIQGSRSGQ